jgi:uncharacterized surface protein with fasciclin (FAS1) repeats
MKKLALGVAALAAGAALVPSVASAGSKPNAVEKVIEVSGASGFDSNGNDYDILREALLATGLVGAVATAQDITVFAPKDSAFVKLADDLGYDGPDESGAFAYLASVTGYVSAADPGLLDDVLLYHVAPDARTVYQLRRSGKIETLLEGATVKVVFNRVIDGDRDDRDARIVRPKNLRVANGIIQTVNRVLRPIDLEPPAPETVVDVVLDVSGTSGTDRNPFDYDLLRDALAATGLDAALAAADDVNVFAPNDGAFIALARDLGYRGFDEAGAFAAIAAATGYVSSTDPGLLDDVLLYHVAPDARTIRELRSAGAIPTLQGGTIDVGWFRVADQDPDDADPIIGFPRNVEAGNGYVHTIFGVLRPIDL